jgi:cytochrome c biogenesis protein CcmG, thiol:disulfide interchange protein DsbE
LVAVRGRRTVAALLGAMLVAACSNDRAEDRFVDVSGKLPTVQGITLDGLPFGPSDYDGRVMVLNFWNQDCPPCLEEAPVLSAAARALAGHGAVFVGVLYTGGGWPDDPAAARGFVDSHSVPYPSIVDPSTRLAVELGVVGIPTTLVVDRTGELRFQLLGKVRSGELEELIERLG